MIGSLYCLCDWFFYLKAVALIQFYDLLARFVSTLIRLIDMLRLFCRPDISFIGIAQGWKPSRLIKSVALLHVNVFINRDNFCPLSHFLNQIRPTHTTSIWLVQIEMYFTVLQVTQFDFLVKRKLVGRKLVELHWICLKYVKIPW